MFKPQARAEVPAAAQNSPPEWQHAPEVPHMVLPLPAPEPALPEVVVYDDTAARARAAALSQSAWAKAKRSIGIIKKHMLVCVPMF